MRAGKWMQVIVTVMLSIGICSSVFARKGNHGKRKGGNYPLSGLNLTEEQVQELKERRKKVRERIKKTDEEKSGSN